MTYVVVESRTIKLLQRSEALRSPARKWCVALYCMRKRASAILHHLLEGIVYLFTLTNRIDV